MPPSYPRRAIALAVLAGASAASITTAHAQSADALIDKLVEKGVLTLQEGNELREETDKGFTAAYSVKSGLPEWVNSLKFNGDFRGRFEGFYGDHPAFVDRNRWRYRLRYGVTAVMADHFEVGFRLGSGDLDGAAATLSSGIDPVSTNQTLQNNGSKKGIFLDTAYARWSPLTGPVLQGSLTLGKMDNPFHGSEILFDNDYTPEGVALQFGYRLSDTQNLKLAAAALPLDELGASSQDPFLLGVQLRHDGVWNTHWSSTAGVAFFAITSPQSLANASVPNIGRGNTRVSPAGQLLHDITPVYADASFAYTFEHGPLYSAPFPIRIAADLIHNPGAPDDNQAFTTTFTVGKAGKKGLWEFAYQYRYLGADSWYEEFVDSDFGGFYASPLPGSGAGIGYSSGTNAKGHVLKLAYSPADSLVLSVKWFATSLIDPPTPGSGDRASRVQLDAVWKF